MQHLLARAVWDHAAVVADRRGYVVDRPAGQGAADARAGVLNNPGHGQFPDGSRVLVRRLAEREA